MKPRILLTILTVLALCSLFACRASKSLPHEYSKEQIIFGDGGGFSGLMNSYVLLDDARLFQQVSDSTFHPMGKVDRSFCKQIFQQTDNLRIDTLDFDFPGNLYYFYGTRKDAEESQVVWGGPSATPPSEIVDLRVQLMEQVSLFLEEKAEKENSDPEAKDEDKQ